MLPLTILQFHPIHWLSQGQVLERILYYMPAILYVFQISKMYCYQQVTTFQYQFMLHLVVDVLVELNKLKKKIQYDMADISTIGCTLNASISFLKRHFLCSPNPNFGQSTKHLKPFLSNGWVDGA